jgi:hypothetical protein
VAQAASANEQHRDDEQNERYEPKVTSPREPALAVPQVLNESAFLEVPSEEFEAGVRREAIIFESEVQVALDSGAKTALSYPHWK